MSAARNAIDTVTKQPWRLWLAQVASVVRLEMKRNVFRRRGIWLYLLAFAPVVVIALHGLESPGGIRCHIEEDTTILAIIFQLYYLRLGVFFGAMGIFTWLIRGEMVENTLHYYLLAPIRRELLVLGKYLAGALSAVMIYGSGVFLSFLFMYSHFGAKGRAFVFQGPGLGHLFSYLGVTVLACLGYGAMFMALSLVFRNPIVPGAIALGWETISGVLPSMLQKFSVTYYLKHLVPVPAPGQDLLALFTVVTEPVAPWLAVSGLLLLSAAVLAFACMRARGIEIAYAVD